MKEHIVQFESSLLLKKSFSSSMNISPIIYTNGELSEALFIEHKNINEKSSFSQLSKVASLPSIKALYGLPDIHSGYGFPIGTVAGFDLDDPLCIVSPGGVGYDINCGVRCVSTNLSLSDVESFKDIIASVLYSSIPTGFMNENSDNKRNNNNLNSSDDDSKINSNISNLEDRENSFNNNNASNTKSCDDFNFYKNDNLNNSLDSDNKINNNNDCKNNIDYNKKINNNEDSNIKLSYNIGYDNSLNNKDLNNKFDDNDFNNKLNCNIDFNNQNLSNNLNNSLNYNNKLKYNVFDNNKHNNNQYSGFTDIDNKFGLHNGVSNINNETLECLKGFNAQDLNQILEHGLEFLVNYKIIDPNEKLLVEDEGQMKGNSRLIGQKAKSRGLPQIASLGSGNHYLEIQYVEEIFNVEKAKIMGIHKKGQIIFMIHTGSRGLGHITCTDFLKKMNIEKNEDLLGYSNSHSKIGKEYLEGMASASNYAFCNRALIDKITRECIRKIIPHSTFNLVYDVCHNIAKKERHYIDNEYLNLLVHRKGASRAFGPNHQDIPEKYKNVGQPVIVGGSMGTSSYILVGTEEAMNKSLGSACHGAGRALSRSLSKQTFKYEEIIKELKDSNITFKCGSEKGLVEEAPKSYKDIEIVVDLCEDNKITEKIVKVKPLIVIKG